MPRVPVSKLTNPSGRNEGKAWSKSPFNNGKSGRLLDLPGREAVQARLARKRTETAVLRQLARLVQLKILFSVLRQSALRQPAKSGNLGSAGAPRRSV